MANENLSVRCAAKASLVMALFTLTLAAAAPAEAQDVCGAGIACSAQRQAIQQLQQCANPPAGVPPDVCRIDALDDRSVIRLIPQPQGRYLMLFATADGSFEARATVLGRRVNELLDLIRGIQAMGGDGVARIAQSAVIQVRNADGTVHRFESELNTRVVIANGSIGEFVPCVKN